MSIEAQVKSNLSSLLGLPISIARDAADMKVFHFGKIRPHPSGKGTVGEFALHVQCPWRLVTNDRILTGSADFYEPVVEGEEVDTDDHQSGNLQLKRLQQVFGSYDEKTRSLINETEPRTVISVHSDQLGGIDLELTGGFRLQVFPDRSRGESWRFFAPANDEAHFVH